MKDNDVIFDFICDKMYKKDEVIVYAAKHSTENDYFYKLITVDDEGTVRKYLKDCLPASRWMQIESM